MSQIVRIEVCLPEGHWAGEATRNHPNAVLQIIETMPLGKGRGTAQIATEPDLLNDLENLGGVERVDSLGSGKASVTIASGGGGFSKYSAQQRGHEGACACASGVRQRISR